MKKAPRKLQLNPQTIAQLDRQQLGQVQGGERSRTGNCPIGPDTREQDAVC